MAIISFKNISIEYSGTQVLDNACFEINAGQKIGLIGPNGSGKTTILKIITNQIKPNEGKVEIGGDVRIGYVPQHVEFESNQTVVDYLLDDYRQLKAKLRQNEEAVSNANGQNMDALLKAYQVVRDSYDHIGGDHFEARAMAMLDALGLAGRHDQPIQQLSGGEKNVLAMTHALLADPNLLILDEPGNHLDYIGLAWLDEFLQRFRGAVLIVSHNRYLLDRVTSDIIDLEFGKTSLYHGNYTKYKQLRKERQEALQKQYDDQQKRIAELKALVQKFADIAQGHASDQSWGKRLRARRSQLEREMANAIEKPIYDNSKVNLNFQAEATKADIALQIKGYSKAFGELELFNDLQWSINGGQRWALIGPNGCGKTTLLRDIVKKGRWEDPIIRIGPSLSIGYCSQQQEVLNENKTAFEEIAGLKNVSHEQALGILARFLFTDEDVHKKIANLSGGERNRLQLARLMLLKPNFLLLDEPTNHLDIQTCEAVEAALSEFNGTILTVSHDRYFLDKIADHVAEVKDKSLRLYDGNFTTYWQTYKAQQEQSTGRITSRGKDRQQDNDAKAKTGGQAWLDRKAKAAILRKAQKAASDLENKLGQTEKEKEKLEQKIADAYTRGDNDKGSKLSQELKIVSTQIEELYEAWMEAVENIPEEE
ncbi:MAG: ATP-binding cassette domain-containing protein [Phycisphaerae bacterium]|nr:ATP-binding cassette domain-containing protein [Phycisphaerae bacterium]